MGPRLDSRGRGRGPPPSTPPPRASMGPRLDSRGRQRTLLRCLGCCPLQWGRGWTAAEGPVSYVHPFTHHLGFNGAAAGQPRKGRVRACAWRGILRLQWGRGWTAAEGTMQVQVLRHNHGFNGAAAGQPRKARAERLAREFGLPLQWGRGWTAAEGRRRAAAAACCGAASMGPRLDSRGRMPPKPFLDWLRSGFNGAAAGQPRKDAAEAVPRLASVGLQWGRGWTAAEGCRRSRSSIGFGRASMGPRLDSRGRMPPKPFLDWLRSGFNGAAAGQPRKGGAGVSGITGSHSLQWGCGWTAAEGFRYIDPDTGEKTASMGPRLDSRGRAMVAGLVAEAIVWLQWGRGWTAAEGR